MTRNTANYWIDLLIFILMLVCFVSGIVIWVWPKNKAPMKNTMPVPAASAPADAPNTAPEITRNTVPQTNSATPNDTVPANLGVSKDPGQEESPKASKGGHFEKSEHSGMETAHTHGNSENTHQHAHGNSENTHQHAHGNSENTHQHAHGNSGTPQQNVHGGQGGQGSSQTFLGLTRRQWKWLHIWPSVVVLGPFLVLHLLMHLKWCVKTTQHLFGFGKKMA